MYLRYLRKSFNEIILKKGLINLKYEINIQL